MLPKWTEFLPSNLLIIHFLAAFDVNIDADVFEAID